MSLKLDLDSDIHKVFSQKWEETPGRVVPIPSDVGLNNKTVLLKEAVVLYADLDGSTAMVDTTKWELSAEIYKAFLLCAAKIITSENGDITAYDGDRIMGIFTGDGKYDRASRAALKINWAVKNTIMPMLNVYWTTSLVVKHTVGIDVSDLRAVRTGVRGDNDLVWVGRAANWAAKLTTLPSNFPTYMTKAVYEGLTTSLKTSNGKPIWEKTIWYEKNNMVVFRSNWTWTIS